MNGAAHAMKRMKSLRRADTAERQHDDQHHRQAGKRIPLQRVACVLLVHEAAARGDMLHHISGRIDSRRRNFNRWRAQSLLELCAEPALLVRASRLPLTERDARGASRRCERERPYAWTERVS